MSKKKIANLVTNIQETEELNVIIEENPKHLLVIEAFKDWCGPCEVLNPTYEQIYIKTESAEKRVMFLTCSRKKHELLQNVDKTDSCKPIIVLYKNGKIVARIAGANAPELVAQCEEFMPILEN